MITISPIEAQDFDALYAIEQAAHAVPWSLGTLKNNQGERLSQFKNRRRASDLRIAICQTVLDEATLFNIAIVPQKQGLGLGRQLLNELITQLRQKGILTLWLEVRESNKKALALYDSLGFNQVDIRKTITRRPDGKRENAVVMAAYL